MLITYAYSGIKVNGVNLGNDGSGGLPSAPGDPAKVVSEFPLRAVWKLASHLQIKKNGVTPLPCKVRG